MNAVTPVTITLPDGKERELRFTLGARKRIHDMFGMGLQEALQKMSDAAIPGVLHCLLYDDKGQEPDVSVDWITNNIPGDAALEVTAAIMSAVVQGRASKNAIEGLMTRAITESLTGSASLPSAPRSSESTAEKSGTDTSNANSSPESTPITSTASPSSGKRRSLRGPSSRRSATRSEQGEPIKSGLQAISSS